MIITLRSARARTAIVQGVDGMHYSQAKTAKVTECDVSIYRPRDSTVQYKGWPVY